MGLIKDAGETLFGESTKDLLVDYAELGLDSVTDSDILKEIPIVKTVSAVAKVSMAIKEKFFLKKFLSFIKEFNSGNVDEKEVVRRKNAFEKDEEWIKQEVEYLVIYIDSMDSIEKARIYAVLYREYINKKIDFDRLTQYIEIVNRMFAYDFKMFRDFYISTHRTRYKELTELCYNIGVYNRLIGTGLLDRNLVVLDDDEEIPQNCFVRNSYQYTVTQAGNYLGDIIDNTLFYEE